MRLYAILALFIFLYIQALADDAALIKQLETAVKNANNTLGYEASLAFDADPLKQQYAKLTAKTPVSSAELEVARKAVSDQLAIVEQGRRWDKPGIVVIPRAYKTMIKIDGVLDDVQWQTSTNYFGGYKLNSGVSDIPNKTEWRLTWDADSMYIGVYAEDATIDVTDYITVYLSSDPVNEDIIAIRVGLTGANIQAHYRKNKEQYGLQKVDNAEKFEVHAATTVNKSEAGYSMEVQIPLAVIVGKNSKFSTFTHGWMMMTRTDTDKKNPITYSWWPLLGGVGNILNYAPIWFDF